MLKVTRWCIDHRRTVFGVWVAIAIITSVIAQAVGRDYANNFTLPGTESQRAINLLQREFPTQSGDLDEFVVHVDHGTIYSPDVRSAIESAVSKIKTFPHVVHVIDPYSTQGSVQVSRDKRTAFATVEYSKRANLLPNDTGTPLIDLTKSLHVPGLRAAAGGQVVEQAEGFNIGPATSVGVIAALVILLITFGTLIAAGMPLITAGLGLVTGVALVGLATRVTSVPNVAPDLALMIGLGVGIDYALFIVTRFRENFLRTHDVELSIVEAMDTSGRAILLAGSTVVIALLGMFATGVSFMYGLSIASVLAVLLVLASSLTVLPAMLSKVGPRMFSKKQRRAFAAAAQAGGAPAGNGSAAATTTGAATDATAATSRSRWRQWSRTVQARPWPLAVSATIVMVVLLIPVFALRLDTSDAGNDPPGTSTRVAFDMLAEGFGPGFNGPLVLVAELPAHVPPLALAQVGTALEGIPDVAAVTPVRLSPDGKVATVDIYPKSAPQDSATTNLVNRLRHQVLPPVETQLGKPILVGGFTAGSIDFSNVLGSKLPLFIALVVVLSALLLLVMFRSVVIAIQAALMNLLSIGAALGVTVAVFQWGWLGSVLGLQKGPVEPWIPVLIFAVVFGLSMDYEVFLVSRVREEWVRRRDASTAVAEGIAFTGRVISAAAAIMVCVFLSFMLGDERTIKEFGFGLAVAVFLDALVVRCVLLPAVLEILDGATWWLPDWLDRRLPHVNIEGSSAREIAAAVAQAPIAAETELERAGA